MKTGRKNLMLSLALGALLLVGAGCAKQAVSPTEATPTIGAPTSGGKVVSLIEAESIQAGGINEAMTDGETAKKEASDGSSTGVTATTPAGEVKVFKVVAKNFDFEPSEIRVKMGDRVRLEVSSADTGAGSGHGIAIPAFNVNVKVDAGKPGVAEFIADKKGSYPFFCNVFCGTGHREMKGTLVVE